MNIVVLCLIISCALPIVAKIPVAVAQHRLGGYNNRHPRAQQSQLTGFGARALAAHQNAFEALIVFGIAATTALATNHASGGVEVAAIGFVVARILYNVMYLIDQHALRSTVWGISWGCSFYILFQCL